MLKAFTARAIVIVSILFTMSSPSLAAPDATIKDPEAAIQSARLAMGSERWEDARQLLQGVSDDVEAPLAQRLSALNLLAITEARQGRYEAARGYLERALSLDENFDQARETLGDVYVGLAERAYGQAERTRASPRLSGKLATVRSLFSLPENEVMSAIEHWRNAWQGRDVVRYLNAYAPDFKSQNGLSPDAWRAQRRQRLKAARTVQVVLEDVQLRFAKDGNTVTVAFVERLAADDYRHTGSKVLELQHLRDGWKIIRETTSISPEN